MGVGEKMNMDVKNSLSREGYVVVKNFYTPLEVEALRALCLSNQFKKKDSLIAGDVITHSSFRNIIFKKQLIHLLHDLNSPYYVCDGSARGDDKKQARKLHTDSRVDDFDFSKPYSLFRFAIYLQDSSNVSGGLKLRPKSHKYLCIDHGKFSEALYRLYKYIRRYKKLPKITFSAGTNLKIKPGDLAIWDMRTHHSGHAVRLKFFPNLALHPLIENIVPKKWVLQPQEKRCVIFFAFAMNSDYAIKYFNYVQDHPSNLLHFAESDFQDKSLKEFLSQNGLHLINELNIDKEMLKNETYF